MVEGGSGAGAAAVGVASVGAAAPVVMAPVVSAEVGAPVLGQAPDVAPTLGTSPGVVTETPDGGATGAAVGLQVSDADSLTSVQDRLVQQAAAGDVSRAGTADDADRAEPVADTAIAEDEAQTAEEAPATDTAPATGETVADGVATESDAGEESATAGEGEGAVEDDDGAGDLELADPATIAEVGLDTNETRLALEVLGGRLNAHTAAARIIVADLNASLRTIPGDASTGRRLWEMIKLPITAVPHVAKIYGVSQTNKEVKRSAGVRTMQAEQTAARALELMSHGTPQMRAFALDVRIETARMALGTVSGKEEVALKAQIEAMQKARGTITTDGTPDGESIPNQVLEMSRRFESMFGPREGLSAELSPLAYIQRVFAEGISNPAAAKLFFGAFESRGELSIEDAKDLAKKLSLEYSGPRSQIAVGAIKGSMALLVAFLTSLYFKMRGQGGRGRAAAGAH